MTDKDEEFIEAKIMLEYVRIHYPLVYEAAENHHTWIGLTVEEE
jgi:hypothetical protein